MEGIARTLTRAFLIKGQRHQDAAPQDDRSRRWPRMPSSVRGETCNRCSSRPVSPILIVRPLRAYALGGHLLLQVRDDLLQFYTCGAAGPRGAGGNTPAACPEVDVFSRAYILEGAPGTEAVGSRGKSPARDMASATVSRRSMTRTRPCFVVWLGRIALVVDEIVEGELGWGLFPRSPAGHLVDGELQVLAQAAELRAGGGWSCSR